MSVPTTWEQDCPHIESPFEMYALLACLLACLLYLRTHTLAQNCHCEFCRGMHLTCKNTSSVTPDRITMLPSPKPVHLKSNSWRNRFNLKKNRLLQQTCRPRQEIVETVKNAGWGSWLSPVPCLSKTGMTKMQVHQGDQPRLPPSCTAWLACVCMMDACPLQIDMKLS